MKLVKKSAPETTTEYDVMPSVHRIAALASDIKAINIKAIDVRGLTVIADVLVIVSAASEPQLKAIFNHVKDGMKEIGVASLRKEGAFDGGWCVLDYGDIIFHVFREESREFFDLDGLWADAPLIELDLDEED